MFTINAELRDETGKGASRRLRHEGKIPAILYGNDKKSQSLTLDHDEIIHNLENDSFYSQILSLIANGKRQRAILRDIQRHPFKPKIMHMDFQRINSKVKLTTSIPFHFINDDTCVGYKAGGIISHQINELEITCFPSDLPEFIEVDIAALDIGDSFYLSEITLPEGVESLLLTQIAEVEEGEESHDQPVVSVVPPAAKEEEPEEEVLEPGEVPVAGEESDDDSDDSESSDE
ncbi:MAG: 50S ribosomal protein L25/general stress protein Ctc [Gammaproteobacteria bacterium]|nr:50S ribosomal protein L25/general stress protein Ctc [Gammaproteobacteria bacterium]